ncbi:hypothetical protein N7481_004970 [Penicillium waksmanii]|uniref:uncharacterized protein n=1 Tax=Penicillium waksmanii TaxID=69791 RepID=UPI0025494223|nr:uncharacterized protein N7481_004970 [Penicillium waksmanii]KAJ5982871.1 hypothetical protein N7481_004970 [Penicillium waksmanii]
MSQETDSEICEISYEEWASQESDPEMLAILYEEWEWSEYAQLIKQNGAGPVDHQVDQDESVEMLVHRMCQQQESPELGPSHDDRGNFSGGEDHYPEMFAISYEDEEWTEQRRRLIEYEAWDLLLQSQTEVTPEILIESAFPLPQSQVVLPSVHWILSGSRGVPVWGPSP